MLYCQGEDLETRDVTMLYGLDTRKSPEGDGDQLGMLSGSTIELGHGRLREV